MLKRAYFPLLYTLSCSLRVLEWWVHSQAAAESYWESPPAPSLRTAAPPKPDQSTMRTKWKGQKWKLKWNVTNYSQNSRLLFLADLWRQGRVKGPQKKKKTTRSNFSGLNSPGTAPLILKISSPKSDLHDHGEALSGHSDTVYPTFNLQPVSAPCHHGDQFTYNTNSASPQKLVSTCGLYHGQNILIY